MRGDVYLISGGRDRIKIGMSINTRQRIHSLRREFGQHLQLLARAPMIDMMIAERAFHDAYKSRRIEREWFKLDKSMLLEAVSILRIFSQGNICELPNWFSRQCPDPLSRWQAISEIKWDTAATVEHFWIGETIPWMTHKGLMRRGFNELYFLTPLQTNPRIVKMNTDGEAFLRLHGQDCKWTIKATAPYSPKPIQIFGRAKT